MASTLGQDLKSEIIGHLETLTEEFKRYFPDVEISSELVKSPFLCAVENVPEEAQEEFIELKNDSSAHTLFNELSLNDFWARIVSSYPQCAKIAFKTVMPFSTSYLCEAGFSAMIAMKNKNRSRLNNVESDLRCALSKTTPNFDKLVSSIQCQKSH